ncbi:MAG TPA: hypothetical protein VIH47_02660 [Solirubrobacterales bacterium]
MSVAGSSTARPGIARIPITIRGIQIALGLIWLLDGALQFQAFMYSHAFLAEAIEPTARMQPGWAGQPILWASDLVGKDLALWNTLFALVQCAIGLGLLYRRTVKPALILSFAWALVVWWFGEGFGMVLMNMGSPFAGSPGAVVLYAVVGVLVWPGAQDGGRSAAGAGALGDRGGLVAWSAAWLCSAALWVAVLARPVYSISGSLVEASGDSMPWLGGLQRSLATALSGEGKPIAALLLVLSLAIAAGVWSRRRRETLLLGALVSLVYWTLGQSLGGLTTGSATDPNIGPLFLLLAVALWPAGVRSAPARRRLSPRSGRGVLQPLP